MNKNTCSMVIVCAFLCTENILRAASADELKEALNQTYQQMATAHKQNGSSEESKKAIIEGRNNLQKDFSHDSVERQNALEKKFIQNGNKQRQRLLDELKKGGGKGKDDSLPVGSNDDIPSEPKKSKSSRSTQQKNTSTGDMTSGATQGAEVIHFGGQKNK